MARKPIRKVIGHDFDPLTEAITTFVQSFDEEYTVICTDRWFAEMSKNIVSYSLPTREQRELDKIFYDDMVLRYPKCAQLNPFFCSLLHEIGHLETEPFARDDRKQRERCTNYKQYFKLYNERLATDWAGEWINENFDAAFEWTKTFFDICQECIRAYNATHSKVA